MKTIPESFTDCRETFDSYARKNPTSSLLIAAGTGFLLGVIAHALQAAMSQSRSAGFLDGLEGRLHKLTDDGSDFMHRNVGRVRRFLS